jgi:hypothetical protein
MKSLELRKYRSESQRNAAKAEVFKFLWDRGLARIVRLIGTAKMAIPQDFGQVLGEVD